MYDIIVIGAGPAGLSAAIYARRSGKTVLVLEESTYGGQIVNTPDVENYPGTAHVSGFDFATNLYNQAKSILGNTVSFMVYGTVKYAEPAEKLENGQYIVTFVTNFAVMNLRDGKIVYQTEFLTTETGASEWEATNKLRTQTIPAIITEKIIYGI